ncbi:PAS domain-containing protein [Spirosoma koreense]
MRKKTAFAKDKWASLRHAFLDNQLQERKDTLALQAQARQALLDRHRSEMAQLSQPINPLGWTVAIHRYAKQLRQLHQMNALTDRALKARQQREWAELESWIYHLQQGPAKESRYLDHLSEVFNWSLTSVQRQNYHQALEKGHTIVVTDLTKSILWASQSFLVMTGYPPLDVVGKTPVFLQGPATDSLTLARVRQRLNRRLAISATLLNYRKNGEPYQCHLTIKPLANDQGMVTHFIAEEYEVYPKEVICPYCGQVHPQLKFESIFTLSKRTA